MNNSEENTSSGERIIVLLASYNGEKYLGEQIDSILRQTEPNLKLIICDDGSTDASPMILQRYSDMYPAQIRFSSNSLPSGSAKANFLGLLRFAKDGEYAMFADQDDIWLPDKTTILMKKMHEAEERHGREVPLLIYSDLQVIDKDRKLIANSFMRYQGYNGELTALNRLLARNCVTGCTMLWNKALTRAALSASYDAHALDSIRMHDHWLSLIAASLGGIIYADQPTVMHRQHGDNVIGALGGNDIVKRLNRETGIRERIRHGYLQAQLLLDVFGNRMPEESVSCIKNFLSIRSSNFARRVFIILKGWYVRESPLQAVAYFLALIVFSNKPRRR
ncbi:MAG: glycosyltransferase family 2 protein [Azoarcus sp.]|nr:glycosyltransferase family 2 protein [Azoarcus sp.]